MELAPYDAPENTPHRAEYRENKKGKVGEVGKGETRRNKGKINVMMMTTLSGGILPYDLSNLPFVSSAVLSKKIVCIRLRRRVGVRVIE